MQLRTAAFLTDCTGDLQIPTAAAPHPKLPQSRTRAFLTTCIHHHIHRTAILLL
jgi:hypothetical protein